MGAKDSKRVCLSYEDAVKRMSEAEFKRVCEAFKRFTNGGSILGQTAFAQYVLGDGVPTAIIEKLYTACGGSVRGIPLRDLICGLVLLTKGTQDEKIKFLWTLYCNDSGTYITRSDFQTALQIEGVLPASISLLSSHSNNTMKLSSWSDRILISLFGIGQDRVEFEHFKSWIRYNKDATILSQWLLSNNCVSLSSELETPTFYQTLAGVTHLEEQDICELEKCFWTIQSASITGHLDFNCLVSLVCPPVPAKACRGLFYALDVNQDEHIDFKELCCGISAACRGPMVERMKFCFKIFDMDRDLYLNANEIENMKQILQFIANENHLTYAPHYFNHFQSHQQQQHYHNNNNNNNNNHDPTHNKALESLSHKLDQNNGLTQEDFLVWSVEDNSLVAPLLELLFQVCHVSLGLRPYCKHNEYEIVMGWLEREQRRGYLVGQYWYLISTDWWQQWTQYTSASRTNSDHCQCRIENNNKLMIEEGIVCDESLISSTTDNNELNSNSMDSMGDLFSRGDSCSIASSSGVSSSSGTITAKKLINSPGPIDNSNLVMENDFKVPTLTGEGGRLRCDIPLVEHRDFELIPDSLWKALQMWYGGPLPLPRQVIKPPGASEVDLELYPLNLKILRHQVQQPINTTSWSSVVGGYGMLTTAGLSSTTTSSIGSIRRTLTHVATFSRLANIQQVTDFLCEHLTIKIEDARLWLLRDHQQPFLLEDERASLQDLGIKDGDQILFEIRNKDLTWPEELGQLAANGGNETVLVERRPTICLPPGATGLHNLGNTCFMNAAIQAVSNTRPLTMYFQQNSQLSELNCNSPNGTKGAVATRYSELCRELWAGSTRSVAPINLRACVTRYAHALSGGGQQDAQELLAWLLDGLHEDLNRVPKKQYIELKDSDGRPDEVVADEAWQYHLKRENSIITDLFHGQLKSKVTCITCGHESVKFDPFDHLSLPLPMESYTLCEILVVQLNGECPVKYGLRLNSEAKYGEVKEHLSRLRQVDANRLILAEVANCQIRALLADDCKLNPLTACELFAYELPQNYNNKMDVDRPGIEEEEEEAEENDGDAETEMSTTAGTDSPLARSPEVRSGGSAICMPNILCFKSKKEPSSLNRTIPFHKSSTISMHSNLSNSSGGVFDYSSSSLSIKRSTSTTSSSSSSSSKSLPLFLTAVHRKWVRQETYFLSEQKSKPNLFGMPLLLGYNANSTCRNLYDLVWDQITRLLSPLPQSDQTNHATDCDDSLGYEFPFTLKTVLAGGQICAICHWTKFCRGCPLPCSDHLLIEKYGVLGKGQRLHVAIDWDPTALHLRYQSSREKLWMEDESVAKCRKLHTEPIDLDYCLRAFTSEERLEAKYHCSRCNDKQPATKKLQIWRLPPILIVHLKRFDYVNNKWVKTQKAVNFPFKDFDPTAYLASVPQETILRHRQLLLEDRRIKVTDETDKVVQSENLLEDVNETSLSSGTSSSTSLSSSSLDKQQLINEYDKETTTTTRENNNINNICNGEKCKLLQCGKEETPCDGGGGGTDRVIETEEIKLNIDEVDKASNNTSKPRSERINKVRSRLISTSLLKSPIIDEHLKDYHEHKLLPMQDIFDLKYQLYAVVSHSGLLTGGHYISYACNPNGNWYCYNDSSCREVMAATDSTVLSKSNLSLNSNSNRNGSVSSGSTGCTPLSKRKIQQQRKDSTGSIDSEKTAPLAIIDSLTSGLDSGHGSESTSEKNQKDIKKNREHINDSTGSINNCSNNSNTTTGFSNNGFQCTYNNVKIPKIDTSSAYILFYERSGLDYKPYLPKIHKVANNNNNNNSSSNGHINDEDVDDSELQTTFNSSRTMPESRSPVLKWLKDKFTTQC